MNMLSKSIPEKKNPTRYIFPNYIMSFQTLIAFAFGGGNNTIYSKNILVNLI